MDATPSPFEAADVDDRRPAHELTADYQTYLEEESFQPHERYAERPPFYPTHVFAEVSVHVDGEVDVIQERRELMVIDGLGYLQGSWEGGTLPEYDVDRHGNWYDLTLDCHVPTGHWGPEALPERCALWREADGTTHLFEIAPTRGGVRELPVGDTSMAAAVTGGAEFGWTLTDEQLARLRDGLMRLPAGGWEVTRPQVLAMALGEIVDVGDPAGRTVRRDGSRSTWEHNPTPTPGTDAGHGGWTQWSERRDPVADSDAANGRTLAPGARLPGVREQDCLRPDWFDPFTRSFDPRTRHGIDEEMDGGTDPDADPSLDAAFGADLAPAS